nr:GNAT family N-acetyltransferase [Paenibacillus xylanexedens]
MRQIDYTKTLDELEGGSWGEPDFKSGLVIHAHALRKKPLCEFNNEDLRLLILQEISLDCLLPLALERLAENPLESGDLYVGDLLCSVLKVDDFLYLSLLETKDAAELFHLIDRNREHIGKWLKFPSMTVEMEDSKAFIEGTRMRYAKDEGYWLGIWSEDHLVGSIGYLYLDQENKKTEIGYWLGQEYEGKGFITKSIKLLIDYAFDELQFNKIEIGAAADNAKSRAIPEKLGFTREGELRDYEYINGRFLDRVIYGLKAAEWRAK